jgi:hypothetical protein
MDVRSVEGLVDSKVESMVVVKAASRAVWMVAEMAVPTAAWMVASTVGNSVEHWVETTVVY